MSKTRGLPRFNDPNSFLPTIIQTLLNHQLQLKIINLLKGRWPFDFRDLSLLPSLDTGCSGIQGIMWSGVLLLMTLQHGRHIG